MKKTIGIIAIVFISTTAQATQLRPMMIHTDYEGIAREEGNHPGFVFCDDCPRRIAPEGVILPIPLPKSINLPIRFSEVKKEGMPLARTAPTEKVAVLDKSARKPAEASAAVAPSASPSSCAKHIVFFRFGEGAIERFEKDQLDQMIPCLKELRVPVSVEGFTCRIGSQSINDRLARQRAEAVKKYLEGQGITVEKNSGQGKRDYMSRENRSIGGWK